MAGQIVDVRFVQLEARVVLPVAGTLVVVVALDCRRE